uniref:Uncharacterized protein n=1 Tax=Arion vulgaris TaxID=1028688 RepID=A0A0B6ZFW9_9EUPU
MHDKCKSTHIQEHGYSPNRSIILKILSATSSWKKDRPSQVCCLELEKIEVCPCQKA